MKLLSAMSASLSDRLNGTGKIMRGDLACEGDMVVLCQIEKTMGGLSLGSAFLSHFANFFVLPSS